MSSSLTNVCLAPSPVLQAGRMVASAGTCVGRRSEHFHPVLAGACPRAPHRYRSCAKPSDSGAAAAGTLHPPFALSQNRRHTGSSWTQAVACALVGASDWVQVEPGSKLLARTGRPMLPRLPRVGWTKCAVLRRFPRPDSKPQRRQGKAPRQTPPNPATRQTGCANSDGAELQRTLRPCANHPQACRSRSFRPSGAFVRTTVACPWSLGFTKLSAFHQETSGWP
jgi:hypothetical protein